jgi:hypothetical protein
MSDAAGMVQRGVLTGPADVGKTCVWDAEYASGDKARREQIKLGINFIVDLRAGRPSFSFLPCGSALLSDAFDFDSTRP